MDSDQRKYPAGMVKKKCIRNLVESIRIRGDMDISQKCLALPQGFSTSFRIKVPPGQTGENFIESSVRFSPHEVIFYNYTFYSKSVNLFER